MSLPPNYNLLKEYPADWYIETGIYRGDSLALAVEAGFKNIIGLELFEEHIDFCKHRFDLYQRPGRINLYHGDSAMDLFGIIEHITGTTTFFLDSHSQMLEGEPDMDNPFPLLAELEQIKVWNAIGGKHQPPVIIIDDMLLWQPAIVGFSNEDIYDKLLEIYPDYNIHYRANPVKQNLLIACPRERLRP
jgi:hypothetical protein